MDNFIDNIIKEIESLKDNVKTLKDMSDENMFYKKIEDKIFENIDIADKTQKDYIINLYDFVYYKEYNNNKERLKARILKEIRNKKIKKII